MIAPGTGVRVYLACGGTDMRKGITGLGERIEGKENANEIQRRMLEAAARRPRDRDELVERLRDGGF